MKDVMKDTKEFNKLSQELKDEYKNYIRLDINGNLVEAWTKINDKWFDITAIELAKIALRKAEEAANAKNN